jgi:hypothetical protein
VLKYEVDMSNKVLALAVVFLGASAVFGQSSPPAQATVTVGGKTIAVRYSAPAVRGRKIFGQGGLLSRDPTYPVWRAGANSATAFHTDSDLTIGNLNVPKGDYTLYVSVKDPEAWELVISKATGQWGLDYYPDKDLGRVKMSMSKPPAMVERLKYTLTAQGANAAKLQLEWENHVAAVTMIVK